MISDNEKQLSAAGLRLRAEYHGSIGIALTVAAGGFGILTSNPLAFGLALASAWSTASKIKQYGAAIEAATEREHQAVPTGSGPHARL